MSELKVGDWAARITDDDDEGDAAQIVRIEDGTAYLVDEVGDAIGFWRVSGLEWASTPIAAKVMRRVKELEARVAALEGKS